MTDGRQIVEAGILHVRLIHGRHLGRQSRLVARHRPQGRQRPQGLRVVRLLAQTFVQELPGPFESCRGSGIGRLQTCRHGRRAPEATDAPALPFASSSAW